MKQNLSRLVTSRLLALPQDVMVSIGSSGTYSRKDLIDHVKKDDEIGKQIAKIELEYLRSFKTGAIYE